MTTDLSLDAPKAKGPVVHAAGFLIIGEAGRTYCGIRILQTGYDVAQTDPGARPIKITRLSRELTCIRCERASA